MAGFAQMYLMAESLRAFPVAARPAILTELGDVSDLAVLRAKANSPVRTGLLRSSIHADPVVARGLYGAYVHLVADAEHARFVEEGTSRMPPRPFLREAGEWAMDEFENSVDHILDIL